MKKTFQVNINGSVFYIDEDAYNLLNTYIDQLRKTLTGEEGEEIIADIESRIAEIFEERISNGSRVIVLADVNSVIEQMGQPSEISDEETEEKEKSTATPPPYPQENTVKKLYRSETDKVFGGVLGGLAVYLNWNVNIMRVLLAILVLTGVGSVLIVAYLIAWMIIPLAHSPRQKLEMTGTPVTVGNVGQSILGTATEIERNTTEISFNSVLSFIGKVVMAFVGIIGISIGMGMIVLLITAISGLTLYLGWGDVSVLDEIFHPMINPAIAGISLISLSLTFIIPSVAMIWGACTALFKTRGASRTVIISAVVVEVLLIIATVVLANVAATQYLDL